MKFNYNWKLADGFPAPGIKKHDSKVFSCFSCGGGSTMGYKLAGYSVIGCNDIDPKMMEVYKENHNPRFSYLGCIKDMLKKHKENILPKELYQLEILDGSPPCSSFSFAGNRSKDWGKEKVFREGQSKQVLDTLFFDFIQLAKHLKPKIVVAENVKGLIQGKAKKYVKDIYKCFDQAGYIVQHWLLNASKMGVPQRRERVFFIAIRKDLAGPFMRVKDLFNSFPYLDLSFNEKEIKFGEIQDQDNNRELLSDRLTEIWEGADNSGRWDKRSSGGIKSGYYYTAKKNLVFCTVLAGGNTYAVEEYPGKVNNIEFIKIGSFPKDYNFLNNKPKYIIGMSVPPVMMANISHQIYLQWISKIQDEQSRNKSPKEKAKI